MPPRAQLRSNGFNGYRADTTAGTWSRRNVAAYGDVEFNDPGGRWTVGTAIRSEHFEDFGTTTNGKLSARVGLTDVLSVRGAVSSGFRAPTPGQQHAFNVTTAFIGGQLTNNGVVPSTSAVAVARGGGQLQPEKSLNVSAGTVVEQGPVTFTADFFQINIDDRVALSQEIALSEPEILTLLAEGIPEAREFPGVPVLPERLLDHDPGAGLDLEPGGRAHDGQCRLQLHGHGAHEHRLRGDR